MITLQGFENLKIKEAPFQVRPPYFSRGDWILKKEMHSPGFEKYYIQLFLPAAAYFLHIFWVHYQKICIFRPFALLDHYSWTTGIGQNFLGKGGCQNLKIQGAPFVISPPQQLMGVVTPVRAMATIKTDHNCRGLS